MTSSRKHPSAAFWIAVALVVVLVGYPLSFGPACWIASRTKISVFFLPNAYRPILWAMSYNGKTAKLLNWYAKVGAPSDWTWADVSDSGEPKWMWVRTLPP